MLSQCETNRQLLQQVVAKLTEIEALTKAQKQASLEADAERIEALHPKIQAAFRAKERAVETWMKHHREHGC